MTPRQKQLLDYIRDYTAKHEYSPSFEEMQAALGLASKSGVRRLVQMLARDGWVTHKPRKARTIQVVDRPEPLPPRQAPSATLMAVRNDHAFMSLSLATRMLVTEELGQRIREGVEA